MKRLFLLLWLAGCQAQEVKPGPFRAGGEKEQLLRTLASKASGIEEFRAFYELEDLSTREGILLELAYQAPDRAKLVFPGRFEVFLIEGTATARFDSPEKAWYRIAYQKEFEHVRSEFSRALKAVEKLCPPLRLDVPGKILFDIGPWKQLRNIRNMQAAIRQSLFPGRFGWFLHLEDPAWQTGGERLFRRDGDGQINASMEVAFLENGFVRRAQIFPPSLLGENTHPGMTLTLRKLSLEPLPEGTFALPGKGDRVDLSGSVLAKLRATLTNELEKTMFRHLVQRYSPPLSEATSGSLTRFFALLYQIDLQSTHDLRGMVELVRKGQEKMVEFGRKELGESLEQDRERTLNRYREEMKNQLQRNLNHVRNFETRVGKEYRRLLRRTLTEVFAPRPLQLELEERSREGLHLSLEENLRTPIEKIHEEQAALLEKAAKP